MSVMSVSTVMTPRLSSRTRAADLARRLLRNAAATPMPIASLARLRIALTPAEAIGADAQAFDQLALRKRPFVAFRIDLGVIADPELDGVDAEFLGHLVDGDFKRHYPRRLAGRTHCV